MSRTASGLNVCLCRAGPGTWHPWRGGVYQKSDAEPLQLDGLGVGAAAADSPGHLA